MKLLIAGDVHGNTQHAIWLINTAVREGCDRVVQLGDFGAWEHMLDGVDFFDAVGKWAVQEKVPFYFLRGNHDKSSLILEKYGDNVTSEGFLECRPGLYYIPDGLSWTWGERTFFALGGAYSVDKGWRVAQEQHDAERGGGNRSGWYWFPEEELTDQEVDDLLLAHFALGKGKVDVMLTHDKPRSANPRWNRKDLPECWPNQDRVERAAKAVGPEMWLHGHLHFRYSDLIRLGDNDWCHVEGLDADPAVGDRFYRVRNSYVVLDLERPISEEALCVSTL